MNVPVARLDLLLDALGAMCHQERTQIGGLGRDAQAVKSCKLHMLQDWERFLKRSNSAMP